MADEKDDKRLVRFDLPRGVDAASIAKAIRENCRRILDEAAEQRQAVERDTAGQGLPETSPSRGPGPAGAQAKPRGGCRSNRGPKRNS